VLTFLCSPGALFLFCSSLITSRDFLTQTIIPTFIIDHKAHPLQSIDLFSLLRGTQAPRILELVNEFLQYQLLYTYVFFRRRTISFLLALFPLLLDFLVPINWRMSSNSPHHCVLSMFFFHRPDTACSKLLHQGRCHRSNSGQNSPLSNQQVHIFNPHLHLFLTKKGFIRKDTHRLHQIKEIKQTFLYQALPAREKRVV